MTGIPVRDVIYRRHKKHQNACLWSTCTYLNMKNIEEPSGYIMIMLCHWRVWWTYHGCLEHPLLIFTPTPPIQVPHSPFCHRATVISHERHEFPRYHAKPPICLPSILFWILHWTRIVLSMCMWLFHTTMLCMANCCAMVGPADVQDQYAWLVLFPLLCGYDRWSNSLFFHVNIPWLTDWIMNWFGVDVARVHGTGDTARILTTHISTPAQKVWLGV